MSKKHYVTYPKAISSLRTITIPLKNIKNYGPRGFVVFKFLPQKNWN